MSKPTQTSFDEMNVYTDGSCYVVATSLDEAKKIIEEEWCCDEADQATLVPDNQEITITVGKDGAICPQEDADQHLTMTAAEWARREGVGQLCSEDC